ncbi:MAG: hypothetical protein K9J13_00240 [Saprospiraceae bacterium]|nr:hypothetical protein [Saprospiraceae bacterium]
MNLRKNLHYRNYLLILAFILSAGFSTYAQSTLAKKTTKIQLVSADKFTKSSIINKDAKRLIGNVVFEHDGAMLYCDSAYLYTESNTMDAFSRVHIKASDSLDIYGDKLNYNGDTKLAELQNNVRMVDNQMTLTTNILHYDMKTKVGSYFTGGKIVDINNKLTSETGYYYSDFKEFFFKDHVVLTNPEYVMYSDTLKYHTVTEVAYFFGPTEIISDENIIYCENGWYNTISNISQYNKNAYLTNNKQTLSGDSLYYDRIKGIGRAFKNVEIIDSVQNIIVQGQFARHMEKAKYSVITDSTLAILIDEGDSLFLHADTLKVVFDSLNETKFLFAYNKVKLFREDVQGMCDSLAYCVRDSVMKMFVEPILWSEKNQLTAEYMEMEMKDNRIKSMNLYRSAFIVEQDDTAKFNQIKGKKMKGKFADNELKRILVKGNAQTIYFVRDDYKKLVGVNKSESTDVTIYLIENEISSMTFLELPTEVLHTPNELSPKELLLNDFTWEDEKRPKNKMDIFRW